MRPLALKIEVDDKYKQRFFDKVLKVPSDDCWYWTGQVNNSGYAYFKMRQKYYQASRISYAIHYGEIPQDKLALHKCDNPICVNPDHLFLGGDKENCKDMVAKGRWMNGTFKTNKCRHGHDYTKKNTKYDNNGHRNCVKCHDKFRKKPNCGKGHPFSGENLIMVGDRRYCRICNEGKNLGS